MPIAPIVGKDYETANGLRATVKLKFDKPDVNGVLFTGVVKLNGDDQAAFWKADGASPTADYTLDSLWPADDARQYQPIIKTDDGIYHVLGYFFAELGSLKHDWYPRGCRFALKLDKNPQDHGHPKSEVIEL